MKDSRRGNEDVENIENTIPQKKKKIGIFIVLKFIWKLIEKVIIIAVIFISAIIITQNVTQNEQAFAGFRIYRVLTGSMVPKYQIGDVILVREKEINEIKIGDDVSYNGTAGSMKGKLVTHQVIGIEEIDGEKVFHTKGIANNSEDPAISGNQITGVVQTKLHAITYICNMLTNRYIFYFGAILPLTIYIFFAFVRRNTRKID